MYCIGKISVVVLHFLSVNGFLSIHSLVDECFVVDSFLKPLTAPER